MKTSRILPVIMAGGAGTRLWPLSTADSPKQFQPLTGPRSSYEETLRRVSDDSLFEPPMVVTSVQFENFAKTQAARMGVSPSIVLEPARRDSAAAIAAATVIAARNSPDRVLLVLAADHLIDGDELFIHAVKRASSLASQGMIVVFGMTPDGPKTSYGYIKPGSAISDIDDAFRVQSFVEKPDLETAKAYVAQGYLWNSGNFLFRADTMLAELRKHTPDILASVTDAVGRASSDSSSLILDAQAFSIARKTSIDYAVMEKASNMAVVAGRFGWSDIGSWDAVWQALPHDEAGNAIKGSGMAHGTKNSLIHANGLTVVVAGLEGVAVVAARDAVLVIPKHRSQEVKEIAAKFGPPATVGAFPKPVATLAANSLEFETAPLVKSSGFREYDARWWFGHEGSSKAPELNLMGATALGLGLGTLLHELGSPLEVVTGHDYRSYSHAIKLALTQGLMQAGARVHDIGLAITPMAYFAQFALDIPAVAMVTASHNENGWTGVKMGADRPVTFGPDEMTALKAIVTKGRFREAGGGSCRFVENFASRYIDDLTATKRINRKLKVVVACGNGTAGAFAPQILERLGVDVVPLHTELDYRFPNYNPNPEDMAMLHDIAKAVEAHGADVGLGFDGDGDRCGVVDNEGHEIFADKIGLMLARDLAPLHKNARFVVDVKSTCLFADDSVLKANGATTDYYKTGHSYIKRRVRELGALAGFEKSGHYFFNAPVGRGYDDGMVTAITILEMLGRNPGSSMADLYRKIPKTWGSPTMSAECADDVKYHVVARVTAILQSMREIGGETIAGLNTVNGVRVVTGDGTWGLVRASSNKPELVVVVESPVSDKRLREMFEALDAVLRRNPEVGVYNQFLPAAMS